MTSWWSNAWTHWTPASINFLIFCGAWSILALGYLLVAPAAFPKAAHKHAVLAVEALTTLFWFAGFIALAVWLSERGCWGGGVCSAAQAAEVFAAFEWALFMATCVMAALHSWRTRGTNNTRSAPEMRVHVHAGTV